ncbi:MAG: methylisocitrate lyase [Alphaproteobacteria bacterium]|jgi:methylisocitrate lyase
MTWLEAADWPTELPGDRFAALVASPGIVRIPGAHNAMAGLLAKKAGFDCLYISGAAITASLGIPDVGILTLDELCFFTRSIYRATRLPILVDADTGYGEVMNVMRTVRELEAAGAGAMQMEDQVLPKKCGHLNGKQLVTTDEMCAKIAAARKARTHLRIVARTDAVANEGLEGGIARAQAYIKAGADYAFADGLTDADGFREFASRVGAPFMANMTEFGKTPYFTAAEFEEMGCKLVIWPVSSMRAAAKAMEKVYAELAEKDTLFGHLDQMQTRAELYQTIGYHDFEALDDSVAATIVPDDVRSTA